MYESILVPTDGSDPADAAIDSAVALARRTGASLHLIHVHQTDEVLSEIDDVAEELRGEAETVLSAAEDRVRDAGLTPHTELIDTLDEVDTAILEYATAEDIDCIVMGTAGRTGFAELVLGSVTERTLRASPVPVIAVHEGDAREWDLDHILVPTDGSEGSTAAADHAIELAEAFDAAVHVLYVVDVGSSGHGGISSPDVLNALESAGQEAVDEVLERARTADLRSVEGSVASGTPAQAITDYADERDVDCIVLGTHGRSGVDRLVLGSVTERVIGTADVPVVGVKAPEFREELRER